MKVQTIKTALLALLATGLVSEALDTEAFASKSVVSTLQTEGPLAEPVGTIYAPIDEALFTGLIRDPVAGEGKE